MKTGDIVKITPDNREYTFFKNLGIPLLGVVIVCEEEDTGLCLLDYEGGHDCGMGTYRTDCWWVGVQGLEVIEEA